MALSRYAGYKLEWIGRIRSKYGPYGSCPASDSALGAVTRPKSPNFAPVAPPTKRARGGRVTATVTDAQVTDSPNPQPAPQPVRPVVWAAP